MPPDETRAFAVASGAPSAVEIDAQEAVDASMIDVPSIALVLIPSVLSGAVGHWLASRAALKKAATDHTSLQLDTYRDQLENLTVRVDRMESRLRRAEHGRDRYRRIAYLALDRVDDLSEYLSLRESTRRHHDPDGAMTSWVPDPPIHLTTEGWTDRRRTELSTLDGLIDDDPDD